MIDKQWLLSVVGRNSAPAGYTNDLNCIAYLTEQSIKYSQITKPYHVSPSVRKVKKYLRENEFIVINSPKKLSVSGIFSDAPYYDTQYQDFESWLSFTSELKEAPLFYRESGSLLSMIRSTESNKSEKAKYVSFQGIRGLLGISNINGYHPGLYESIVKNEDSNNINKHETDAEHDEDFIPIGGKTTFRLPYFWTADALTQCQSIALDSTLIWTAGLRDASPMAAGVVWEQADFHKSIAKQAFHHLTGNELYFAVHDDYIIQNIMSTPDYARIRTDRLQNKYISLNGTRIDASGVLTRALEEKKYISKNIDSVVHKLGNGALHDLGVIDYKSLQEIANQKRLQKQEAYFLIRCLELERWIDR